MFKDYYNAQVSKEIEISIISSLENGDFEVLSDYKWPNIFFNSRFRANVLCYLDVNNDTDILEIGSNYGTIVEYYLNKVNSYDCYELNENSKRINELRNKGVNFVDIYSIKNKYDYIILFESLCFVKSPEELLMSLKTKLKDNGHLIIVENNRNGYLYLSGKKNEHSGKVFDSSNYFSRSELINLINKSGYKDYKFFYPYPNIMYTTEVFTDYSVNEFKPVSLDNSLDEYQIRTFDDKKYYLDMMEIKQMQNFVNSFVIDCSCNPINGDYLKVWSNRDKSMSIITIVDYQRNKVYKLPYSNEANEHLCRMNGRSIEYGKMKELVYTWKNEKLECDILHLESLSDIYSKGDSEKKKQLIQEYVDLLVNCSDDKENYSGKFKEAFGDEECKCKLRWIENGNTDMSFDNIFVDKDKWILIDSEWNLQIKIPIEFIIYRTLSLLGLKTVDIIQYVKTDEAAISTFEKWQNHLCYKYHGTKELCFHRKEKITQYRINEIFTFESYGRLSKKICAKLDRIIKSVRG